jgi:hypothetical protein
MCIVQKVIHKDEIEVQALSLLSPLNEGHTSYKIIYNDISFIERSQIVKTKLESPKIITKNNHFWRKTEVPIFTCSFLS